VQVAACTVATASTLSQRVDACTVETISDVDAFLRLEGEWNDAVDRAGVTHPFLRHEWLLTWWQCFSAGRRLHLLIVRSGPTIVAIAPLLWETARMYGVPIRRLRLMHNDHTPRADFIVASRADAAYRAIWAALRADREQWDVLQLGQLPAESPTRDAMTALAAADGCTTGVWRGSESPYLALTGTWEAYERGLTGKFRQNLRNRLSRLRRIGEPSLEVIDGGPAARAACEDAIRLEASGWKRAAGTAISSDPAVHRFYTSLVERAAASGWLRLIFLTVRGRRIATSYSFSYERRLFLCKTGYDPDYETCAPFKLLTSFALRDTFARGFVEMDFLGDAEPWKLEWTTTSRAHEWLFVFSNTSRARLLYPLKFQLVPAIRSAKAFALQGWPRNAVERDGFSRVSHHGARRL
jgi:CelD/BcsL family acetyltransferase involved in cellulose biosynthesis